MFGTGAAPHGIAGDATGGFKEAGHAVRAYEYYKGFWEVDVEAGRREGGDEKRDDGRCESACAIAYGHGEGESRAVTADEACETTSNSTFAMWWQVCHGGTEGSIWCSDGIQACENGQASSESYGTRHGRYDKVR